MVGTVSLFPRTIVLAQNIKPICEIDHPGTTLISQKWTLKSVHLPLTFWLRVFRTPHITCSTCCCQSFLIWHMYVCCFAGCMRRTVCLLPCWCLIWNVCLPVYRLARCCSQQQTHVQHTNRPQQNLEKILNLWNWNNDRRGYCNSSSEAA